MITNTLIIGGGPLATNLGSLIRSETNIKAEELAFLFPEEELMQTFKKQAHNTQTKFTRSNTKSSIQTRDIPIDKFLEQNEFKEAFINIEGAKKLSIEAYIAHAEEIIKHYDFDKAQIKGMATSIQDAKKYFHIQTDNKQELYAKNVILSLGGNRKPRMPKFMNEVSDELRKEVKHVYDKDFSYETLLAKPGQVAIVGGGMAGCELAITLAKDRRKIYGSNEKVMLITDKLLEVSEYENPREWTQLEEYLIENAPEIINRMDKIERSKKTGTITQQVFDTIDRLSNESLIEIKKEKIQGYFKGPEGNNILRTNLYDNKGIDTLVLATGFDNLGYHNLIANAAEELGLETFNINGTIYPNLSPRDLSWRKVKDKLDDKDDELAFAKNHGPNDKFIERYTKDAKKLYVTGDLAAPWLGPSAGNIHRGSTFAWQEKIKPTYTGNNDKLGLSPLSRTY